MSRIETAVEILKAGGYFRKALESTYMGEKFKVRLHNAQGQKIKGISGATLYTLQEQMTLKEEIEGYSSHGVKYRIG